MLHPQRVDPGNGESPVSTLAQVKLSTGQGSPMATKRAFTEVPYTSFLRTMLTLRSHERSTCRQESSLTTVRYIRGPRRVVQCLENGVVR